MKNAKFESKMPNILVEYETINSKDFKSLITYSEARIKISMNKLGFPSKLVYAVKMGITYYRIILSTSRIRSQGLFFNVGPPSFLDTF